MEFSPSQQHESYERQKAPNLQPVDSILLSNQKELKAESQPKLPEPVGATFKAKAGNRPKSEIVAHDTKGGCTHCVFLCLLLQKLKTFFYQIQHQIGLMKIKVDRHQCEISPHYLRKWIRIWVSTLS